MILDKTVKVILNASNISRYKKLEYVGNVGDVIESKIIHLSKGSHVTVEVKCDYCGIKKNVEYNSLFKNDYLERYYCKKCKSEQNLMNKYGVKNVFQLDIIKNKSKKTILDKYGVDNVSKNEDIKKKKTGTCMKNFGSEQPLSSQIIKDKSVKTLLERYGVSNISKVNDIKIKKEKTCLENYGHKYISQSEDFKRKTKSNVIEYLKNKYGVIDYNEIEYKFHCNKCGKDFLINKKSFYTRFNLGVDLCTLCNPIGFFSVSGEEQKLLDFIRCNTDYEIINNSKVIPPYELDVYIPELKLAFEFNGLYWHSELFKQNKYHLDKTEMCMKLGIKLIHIYEDDWMFKRKIINSIILNSLNKTPNKIFARKCEIEEISDNVLVKEFLNENHLQGCVGSKIKIGLFYNEELVSLMTFGSLRKSMGQKGLDGHYEMLRFCNRLNTNVIGGASKLFKHFIENYKPKDVTSYANRSWSNGELYEKLKFDFVKKTDPNYYYIIDKKRKYRFGFRKDKLIKDGFDPNKTEKEIMLSREIYRIYDSGNLKYVYKN